MGTLAVYTSRTGFTTKALDILSNKMDIEIYLHNLLDKKELPKLESFDRVLIGGSIYREKVNPALLKFCKQFYEILKTKKLGFFVSSLSDKERAKDYLFQSFPKDLLNLTRCKCLFGGEITLEKLSLWDRFILKITKGIEVNVSNINLEEIERYARCLQKQKPVP